MIKLKMPDDILMPEIKTMLAEGLTVTLPVRGNSMLPFIAGGRDSVMLRQPFAPFRRGEIVLAHTVEKGYVIHRIVACREGRITLMGDGNLCGETEECSPEDVLGVVTKIIKRERTVNCRSPFQRTKARLWYMLLPARRYLLAVYRRLI